MYSLFSKTFSDTDPAVSVNNPLLGFVSLGIRKTSLRSNKNTQLLLKLGIFLSFIFVTTSNTFVVSPLRLEGGKQAAAWKELVIVVLKELITGSG